jgi:hypothetical protein
MYLPLIPRLQAMFQSKEKIGFLSYRHQFEHEPGWIQDVFDGSHYRSLLHSKVVVDGVERPYHYFSGKDDIALALSVDGYLLFQRQRRGPSATPILGQIFNLPPQICCHFQELLSLGIIPGPRLPKDYASFMVPVDNELAELAYGVQTFNAIDRLLFDLHAYCIQKHGDIVAIERLLGLKGHSSFRPCRSCRMTGVRDITGRGTIYYIPLRTPIAAHQERPSVDPRALPPRTKRHFNADAKKLEAITSATARDDAAKLCGISRRPALRRVGAFDPAKSCPWEWMHLFCENTGPNLVKLWTGKFKGLDSGTEEYELDPKIWGEIGRETAAAVKDIPASFVRVLGNIAEDRSMFTAESWGFWLMYVAPIVLRGRFIKDKYYTYLCALSKIMKTTLKFELTLAEIDDLEEAIIDWVEKYEKYVLPHSCLFNAQ